MINKRMHSQKGHSKMQKEVIKNKNFIFSEG